MEQKAKIEIWYKLTYEARKKYCIEGVQVPEDQTLIIETNNELLIKDSILGSNYLYIDCLYQYFELLELKCFDTIEKQFKVIKIGIDKAEIFINDKDILVYKIKIINDKIKKKYFNKLLEQKDIEAMYTCNIEERKELENFVYKYNQKLTVNQKEIDDYFNQEKEEKERIKLYQEKKQKEIEDFIDTSGSELLKSRFELGYNYKDLCINEIIDTWENEYLIERKILDEFIKGFATLACPKLEIMVIEKELIREYKEKISAITAAKIYLDKEYIIGYKIDWLFYGETKARYYKF